MDAVGLASSIITFIDVAGKILRGAYEVYKSSSGATEEHDHTARVVGDLRAVARSLTKRTHDINDPQLIELSEACHELSLELINLLNRFLPKGPGPWQSFRAACRIMRQEKEVGALEQRLDRYRQQISQRLIVLLLYVLSIPQTHPSKRAKAGC